MTSYRVSVKFVNDDQACIIWMVDSTAEMMLMERVEKKLQDWLCAEGLKVKKMNAIEWSIMLGTIHLGRVSIKVVDDEDKKFWSYLMGENYEK